MRGVFDPLHVRLATILEAEPLEGARKPAYRLRLDVGPLGERRSSAQLTVRYRPEDLVGKQVFVVLGLPPKRIAGFTSECLVLGLDAPNDGVMLLIPDGHAENGTAVY